MLRLGGQAVSAPCADLDPFFDGELSKEEAGTFREHLATCERCQAALHGRMQEEVVAGEAHERVERPRMIAAKPVHLNARRRRIVTLAPLLAAAAAFVIWLVGTREPEQPKPIEVSLTIESHGVATRGGSAMRSSHAHVGDVLRPMVYGGRHQAIWVYLDDHDPLAACPGSSQCNSVDGGLTLELRVTALGQYSIIALTSAEPILAPHGPLDAMLNTATATGAHIEIRHVDVD
jgi:hypothetical protein